MAVFTYSEATIKHFVQKSARMRKRVYTVAAVLLAFEVAVLLSPLILPGIHMRMPERWVTPVLVIPFVLFLNGFQLRKRVPEKLEAWLRSYSVDVSPYSVRVQRDFCPQRQFTRDEILRVEEPSWGGGLYLRSPNRYRWLVIPRGLEGYDRIKDELRGMGIPFSRKVIPTNWEEFAFVLLFIGVLICDMVTQSRQVLTANLIVAVLVGIGGFIIISSNPDSPPRMRWVRFAAFLPAAFTILWFFL